MMKKEKEKHFAIDKQEQYCFLTGDPDKK
jgi:hypothetical protein